MQALDFVFRRETLANLSGQLTLWEPHENEIDGQELM